MPNNDSNIGLARDLTQAIDDLQTSLQRASEATSTIRELVPRVVAIGSLFDELEAVINSGRAQVGATAQSAGPAVYSRPTLVTPTAPQSAPQPWTPALTPAMSETPVIATSEGIGVETPFGQTASARRSDSSEALTCFRLEFESTPGPLDLRTVDDAVSEHPDVRDVALLDYDGRKATLKVWIVATAQPSSVQESLTERASQLFGAANDVSVVALEDVA